MALVNKNSRMSHETLLVLSTCPAADASRLARALVEARLAACVNIVGGIESHYVWEGKLEASSESLLVCKTTCERFAALRDGLLALHPYKLPEIVALDVVDGHVPYLDWVRAEVGSPPLEREAPG